MAPVFRPLAAAQKEEHTERKDNSMHRHFLPLVAVLGAVALLGVGCPARQQATPTPPPPGGVYRSDDGGRTFVQKAAFAAGGDITRVAPSDVLIDPFQPSRLYMASGVFGLLRSADAAETWEQLSTPTATVTSVALHPRNPNILYIAGTSAEAPARSKIWKTFDGGQTWREIFTEPLTAENVDRGIFRRRRVLETAVMTVAVDPASPEVVYAASSSGALLASTDGGQTWGTRRSFALGLNAMKLSPALPGRIYVRLADGTLGRSDDGGRTARRVPVESGDVRATTVYALLLEPRRGEGEVIFAGTDRGLFRSENAGDSWEVVPLPVSARQVVTVNAIARGANGALWAGSNYNIYSSIDDGSTWRVQQFDFANPIRFILTDPANPAQVYAFFLPGS